VGRHNIYRNSQRNSTSMMWNGRGGGSLPSISSMRKQTEKKSRHLTEQSEHGKYGRYIIIKFRAAESGATGCKMEAMLERKASFLTRPKSSSSTWPKLGNRLLHRDPIRFAQSQKRRAKALSFPQMQLWIWTCDLLLLQEKKKLSAANLVSKGARPLMQKMQMKRTG
jgi:hypothetical protein